MRADDRQLELRVAELSADGAKGLVADANLPGVGNVFEQVADEIATERGDDADDLVLRLKFRS